MKKNNKAYKWDRNNPGKNRKKYSFQNVFLQLFFGLKSLCYLVFACQLCKQFMTLKTKLKTLKREQNLLDHTLKVHNSTQLDLYDDDHSNNYFLGKQMCSSVKCPKFKGGSNI